MTQTLLVVDTNPEIVDEARAATRGQGVRTVHAVSAAAAARELQRHRFDLVLWVNGLPLVVGETKAPAKVNLSWLNGATDIHNGYEVKVPGFFVPNVMSFATEGREFRYGAVRQPPETWLNWGSTTDEIMQPGLPNVMRSTELLLSPEMVLEVLRTFTLYSLRRTMAGAVRQKVIPRYPQVEAVAAIVDRCMDPTKRQGLVWHHQGSGKTFAMAFAAGKLRQQAEMDAPTIVIVLAGGELRRCRHQIGSR